ncbi:hypothetical protein GCM10011529_31140 [Polymorphobacter glacialis]|uniref:Uncharacterized protein n=1 Tax=Sandarakinorhabdus glacialis TaxID=1614636 RepID=A0A917A1B7_9SPHN|nr:hypothetical protein [Polymorphobacter glacialis]GGE22311.1 hypothetical protein GCM10011529_31140 [Polymorphobacter glacialis]
MASATLNARYRHLFSNDLGAVGGFLFDVESGRYLAPSAGATSADDWIVRLDAAKQEAVRSVKPNIGGAEIDRSHSEVQAWLRDLGRALGYGVWMAANDRGRLHDGVPRGAGCLERLPPAIELAPGADMIRLIDVLWLESSGNYSPPCQTGLSVIHPFHESRGS